MEVVRLSSLTLATFTSLEVLLVIILLMAEPKLGPQCSRKDYLNKNSDTIGNQTRDLPAVAQCEPTAPPPTPLHIFRLFISPLPYFGVFSAATRSLFCGFLKMFTIPHFSTKLHLRYTNKFPRP